MRNKSQPIEAGPVQTRQPLTRYDVAALMLHHWWMLALLWLLTVLLILWV